MPDGVKFAQSGKDEVLRMKEMALDLEGRFSTGMKKAIPGESLWRKIASAAWMCFSLIGRGVECFVSVFHRMF